jgi:hypothetical protein
MAMDRSTPFSAQLYLQCQKQAAARPQPTPLAAQRPSKKKHLQKILATNMGEPEIGKHAIRAKLHWGAYLTANDSKPCVARFYAPGAPRFGVFSNNPRN